MKISFFALLFCFISVQAQWVKIENPSEVTKIRDVQIVNETQILAATTKGGGDYYLYSYFMRKKSLGESWKVIKLPNYVYDIRKIDFVDSLNGYAIAQLRDNNEQAVIMKTDSGGERWRLCFTTPDTVTILLNDVKYINNKICLAVGFAYGIDKSFIVLSEDGGWNWKIIEYPLPFLQIITPVSDSSYHIISNFTDNTFGKVIYTADYCKSFTEISTPQPQSQVYNYDVKFFKKYDDDIFIGGLAYMMDVWEPIIYKSINEGLSWESISSSFTQGYVCDMEKDFSENRYYFACSKSIYSSDMEITNWEITKLVNSNDFISDICISDSIKIAHSYYNIFVYDSTAIVNVKTEPTNNLTFKLSQNYPNPFNPSTTINYSLPISSKVVLKVYDILGNEISTLVNKEQSAGGYEVEFDAHGLSSGIYFYRIIIDKFSETKEMLLLR